MVSKKGEQFAINYSPSHFVKFELFIFTRQRLVPQALFCRRFLTDGYKRQEAKPLPLWA